jgi:hypothetical protein
VDEEAFVSVRCFHKATYENENYVMLHNKKAGKIITTYLCLIKEYNTISCTEISNII